MCNIDHQKNRCQQEFYHDTNYVEVSCSRKHTNKYRKREKKIATAKDKNNG